METAIELSGTRRVKSKKLMERIRFTEGPIHERGFAAEGFFGESGMGRGPEIALSHKFYLGARIIVGFNLLEGVSALILFRSLGRVRGTRPLPRIWRSCFNFIPIRLFECGVGSRKLRRQDASVVRDFAIPIPDRIHLNFRHRMESHIGT